MLLLFLEAVKVFAAGVETVLEILDLVAEPCDVLGLCLKVDGGEGVGEIMGLDVRLEVVELDQRGVHVGLYRGSGFFELLDVGIHQLELLEHLVDFFGMQVLQHRVAGDEVALELDHRVGFKFAQGLGVGLHLFLQGVDALDVGLGGRVAGGKSQGGSEQ